MDSHKTRKFSGLELIRTSAHMSETSILHMICDTSSRGPPFPGLELAALLRHSSALAKSTVGSLGTTPASSSVLECFLRGTSTTHHSSGAVPIRSALNRESSFSQDGQSKTGAIWKGVLCVLRHVWIWISKCTEN